MVYVRGKARIRHSETGEIYEIYTDQIEFHEIGQDERGMGPETTYSAILHHPQLGQLVWYLWEYPIGAENDRETDIGPHQLLEDIDFGLEGDPLDDDYGGDGPDDDDRQSRIEALVKWFFERFEDPAHRVPYVSAEGGYQWIYGGPYDARVAIGDNFPHEAEEIIDAAVDKIESEGLTEWAPVSSPRVYDERETSGEQVLSEIVRELDHLISQIPESVADPVFSFGEDGLVHVSEAPDRQSSVSDGDLLEELRSASADLRQALAGTNAHGSLLKAINAYEAAVLEDPISISRVYARGVTLENAAQSVRRGIEAEELLQLTVETEQNLNSVLDLHATFIMTEEAGRRLVAGAADYRRTPDETANLRAAAEQISAAADQLPDVFSERVREILDQIVQDVGEGMRPERSNQIAVASLGNMMAGLLKGVGGVALGAIVGGAVAMSAPGATAIIVGASAINAVASFLISIAPLLGAFAGAAGSALAWLTPIAYLLDRLRRIGRK